MAIVNAACTSMSLGSHTSGNGWLIVIDALIVSIVTSQAAGRNSKSTLSKVYFTIWWVDGSTHNVTSATLFISRRNASDCCLFFELRSSEFPRRLRLSSEYSFVG